MRTVVWEGWELVFPVNQIGQIWTGGHFGSAREESGPVFRPGLDGRMHAGCDLACAHRAELYAIADGKVWDTGYNTGAGNYVTIRHQAPWDTFYWWRCLHIDWNATKVKVGDLVKAGDVYALADNTGSSKGDHAHVELTIVPPYAPWYEWKHVDIEYVLTGQPGRCYLMITAWQKKWKQLGYYSGVVDGIMGPMTEDALSRFADDALKFGDVPAGGVVLEDHTHKNRFAATTGPVAERL